MRSPSNQARLTALLCAVALSFACPSPDEDDPIPDMSSPDLAVEQDMPQDSPPDLAVEEDLAPDLAPSPCEGVDCGPDGRCEVVASAASCACDAGFIAQGLTCTRSPAPPSLDNLPASESGATGIEDTFQLMVSDPNGDALTLSADAMGCPFPVSLGADNKLVWTCTSAGVVCEVQVTAADPGGLTDTDKLIIACLNGLPTFSSTPPAAAAEGVELRYAVECDDPDGSAITLSIAPDDTCGGMLQGAEYVFTPTEAQGGTSCLMHIRCGDGVVTESQSSMIAIAEVNTAPTVSGVTITPVDPTPGQLLTCQYTFSDADGDADASRVEWIINGQLVATGPTLATYALDDTISCRVTASDGALSGPTSAAPLIRPIPPVTAYHSGRWNGCAISNGALYCWGDNDYYSSIANQLPRIVDTLDAGVTAVSSSGLNFCAIKFGALYCWGVDNQNTQLGADTASRTPRLVPGMETGVDAVSLSSHVCVIKAGALYCWGKNDRGQLGDGTTTLRSSPTLVPGMESDVTTVETNEGLTCAIKSGGLFCWGGLRGSNLPAQLTPAPIANMASDVTDIALGENLRLQNNLYAVRSGALYSADASLAMQLVPQMTSQVSDVSTSYSSTCAIKADMPHCWGSNSNGQLGDGTTTNRANPAPVIGLPSGAAAIHIYNSHACALLHTGALYCWGKNNFKEQGTPERADTSIPTRITVATHAFEQVVVGSAHQCALRGGAVYCWGDNASGQLGRGNTTQLPSFGNSRPLVPGMTLAVSAISAGSFYNCALRFGAVYCWGRNEAGQLGDGTTTRRLSPTPIPSLSEEVTALTSGEVHSCAIQSGAVYCWGDNTSGQLGDGTTISRPTPALVPALATGVTHLAAGRFHTCAIKANALYCWGLNGEGQLGDGTTTNRLTPQPIVGMSSGVSAIAPGAQHTCAIKASKLYCWGFNDVGQIGDGPFVSRPLPSLVPALSSDSVSRVWAGPRHTCALKGSGLYCWGANSQQPGGVSPPTLVTQINAPDELAIGATTTFVTKSDTITSWTNTTGNPSQPLPTTLFVPN